jgi:hypothetical protein
MEQMSTASSSAATRGGETGLGRIRLLPDAGDGAAAAASVRGGSFPLRTEARDEGVLPVALWLRLEGLAMLGLGVVLWGATGGHWLVFALALLVPDVGIVGYLAGPRWGAFAYDLTHNLALPVVAVAIGIALAASWLVLVGALLIAHAGMDRAIGYGLKYASGFRDTHLQRV